jgi:peptidoglycan/LPS O-acetylase OafA/YrhL
LHPTLSHPKYRADIDGLRAVAVLSVVVSHAFPGRLNGGFAGVDVFFVISGFLISTIIFENLHRANFSFAEFYARRIRRIFPALLVVLIASYAFGWWVLLGDEYKQLGKHTAAGAGFVSNIAFWREAGYFDNAAGTKPLLHLWSLGVEEQFYIVWPLLLWIAWKRRIGFIATTAAIALASFYLNIKGVRHDAAAAFFLPQARFWELLSGSAVAWVLLNKGGIPVDARSRLGDWLGSLVKHTARKLDTRLLANVLSLAGFALLSYGFWQINKLVAYPGKWATVPVVGTVLLLSAGPEAWINRVVLSNRLAVWFGVISYPLYLWHWPLLTFARILEGSIPSRNIRVACVALAIGLAWLTYRFVERYLRFGGNSRIKVAALASLMVVVGAVGYGTDLRDGFPSRLPGFSVTSADYSCPEGHLDHEVCKIGNRDSAKTMVAYGDSHLAHLLAQLDSKLGKDYAIDFVYSAGCFMGDRVRIHGAETNRAECDRKIEALERMRDAKPAVVITAQRWHGYNVVTKDAVSSAIQDRVDAFGMKPGKLIILGTTANVPFECEKSKQRPFERFKNCPQDEANKTINKEFIDVTTHMTVPGNVFFVYPYKHLCPDDRCVISEGGVSNFFNFNHLTFAGGEGVAREIDQIVRR